MNLPTIYDTIDWLIKTVVENNNGRIGTYGICIPDFTSSAGSIGFASGAQGPSPQAWFRIGTHGYDIKP
ncbi:MAG: hypothetical protein IPJ30_12160 [Acidobacteria bacterium]|nr:hypothetical protein [Acidobacteriota bacterium]